MSCQMLLLEQRIVDVNNPLTIEELKEELTLRFERMIDKTDSVKLCSSKVVFYWWTAECQEASDSI
jgi:hypothetical protein